jgi:hypothetical protein
MGPLSENKIYDAIWCNIDQCHYMIERHPENDLDYHLRLIKDVARGMPTTLAGTNANGVRELKDWLENKATEQRVWYYKEFLKLKTIIIDDVEYALVDEFFINPGDREIIIHNVKYKLEKLK